MNTFPTFYDPDLPGRGEQVYHLSGPEARHAISVRRIRPGERIDVVDGEGTRIRGEVTHTDKSTLTMAVLQETFEESPQVRILLVQALAKGGRDEAAIEAATEVGLDGVIAWEAERSVSQWRGDKEHKGLARWEAIIISAMKQSRRAHRPRSLGFARGGRIADLIPSGARVLVLHEQATTALTRIELPSSGVIALVVGPEGGLTEEEVQLLAGGSGATAVRLGPEVVRTSTAGPAAIAVLNARLGRW